MEFPTEKFLEQTPIETNQINDASESNLINAETIANSPPRHQCPFCAKSFVNRIAVRIHMCNIHPNLTSVASIVIDSLMRILFSDTYLSHIMKFPMRI